MIQKIGIKHIGINAKAEEALRIADLFSKMLGIPTIPGEKSDFSGSLIEVMKGCGRGTHGHIAFGVDSIEEAVLEFQARGVQFDSSSAQYDEQGKMKVLYLQGEYGGFAVHLARWQQIAEEESHCGRM